MKTALFRKSVVLGLTVILSGAAVMAQNDSSDRRNGDFGKPGFSRGREESDERGGSQQDRAKRRIQMLKKHLGLTDEQAEKLHDLLEAERKRHEAFKEKLKNLLGEEKFRKFEQMQQQMRQRMQQRRQQDGGMRGGGGFNRGPGRGPRDENDET